MSHASAVGARTTEGAVKETSVEKQKVTTAQCFDTQCAFDPCSTCANMTWSREWDRKNLDSEGLA
jgi:hypothetical protein